jgi:predicted  nucleic acid-binding Zn-ribbon protein
MNNTMTKKIFTLIFCLSLAISAFAQDSGTCGANLVWILSGEGANKTLTITGVGAMSDYSNGSAPWYSQRQDIKTLVVDNSVTTIGNSAFYGCEYITSATIGIVITTIGHYAFSGCSRLSEITIPDNITSVGYYAFRNCTQLVTVNFNPTNCTTMGGGSSSYPVFDGCSNFTTLNIGGNVTRIPDGSFRNCTGLVTVVVPDNVKTIGSTAFGGCSSLVNLTLPFIGNTVSATSNTGIFGYIFGTTSYTGSTQTQQYYSGNTYANYYIPSNLRNVTITNDPSIPYGAFSNCSMLTNISINESNTDKGNLTIGSSVTSIEGYAFQNCTGITTVNFDPTNCSSMGSSAYPVFSGCTNFTTLNIGNNVTRIPSNAFCACNTIIGNFELPNIITYIGANSFYNCSGLSGILTVPAGVTYVGGDAYANCTGLTAVNFNATNCTDNAGSAVFRGCTNFTTLNIANNVTRIPDNIFRTCNQIENNLVIPQTVNYIGNYAFYDCTKMPSQNLPLSFVDNIGNYAFYNCMKLDGYLTVKDVIGNYAFGLCIALDSVNIPSTAQRLGDDAFFSCLGLKTVNYNAVNCTYMGTATLPVFSGCSGVNRLNIASDVTTIPDNAFYSLSGLPTVIIPESVNYLGVNAFRNCTGLSSVIVPNSVATIGESAFSGCASLVEITLPFVGNTASASNASGGTAYGKALLGYIFGATSYTGGISKSQYYSGTSTYSYYFPQTLRNVTVTDGTQIKYGAFSNVDILKNVLLPNTLTTIQDYAFSGCSGLTSFALPPSVTTINSFAFAGCTGLKSIEIPENMNTVGTSAFQNCTGLTSLNFNATNCTAMGNSSSPVFGGCTSLHKIQVNNNVTRIADYSFSGCTNLDTIVSYATTIPAAYAASFNGLTPADIAVVVPCNTLADYQGDSYWGAFTNTVEGCDNYAITVSAGDNGQISPSDTQTVAFGQTITFTFTPDANYAIEDVLIDGVSNPQAIEKGTYTFENVSTEHSISVTFKILTYTITVSAGDNGSITPDTNQTVNYGDNLTFTFTPNSEYEAYQVLIDKINDETALSAGSYTFENVTEDHSIAVNFKLTGSVIITTESNGNGIVIGDGIYERDSTAVLYAVPSVNTVFASWEDGNLDNPRTVATSNNLNFKANFVPCDPDSLLLLNEINAELNEQLAALETDTVNLHNQILNLQADTALYKRNTLALLEQIYNLQADTTNLKNQAILLNTTITQLIADTLRLYDQVVALQIDTINSNAQIAELQAQISNLYTQISALQDDLFDCNIKATALQNQVTTLTNDLSDSNETNSQLNVQISALQDDLSECDTNATALQDQVTTLTNDLADCGETNSQLNVQISVLQDDLSECNTNATALQDQVTTLTNDLSDSNETNSQLNVRILELQLENGELQDSIVLLNQLLEDCLYGQTDAQSVENSNVKIYPNPVNNGMLYIEGDLQQNASLELYDMKGKRLAVSTIKNEQKIELNFSNYLSGTYLLRIGNRAYKVVKE